MCESKLEIILEGASNVYRTEKFIVKQCLDMEYHDELDNAFCSQDTYVRRTKLRDREYERLFPNKNNPNGRRIHSTMYSRVYIE